MMSNNTFNNSNPLAKADELHKFESSFFPAGGAPQLANIPQAPPAPTNLNNVRSKPINLKTRNWGPKLENGFGGLNRSLYDRPNSWDSRPIMGERAHLNNNNVSSFPSSSTTSTSRSLSSSVPSALAVNKKYFKNRHNNLIHGKRLRIRNWGHPTAEGWSGMNRDLYNRGLKIERDVLLNELRYKYGPRPNFQQQERAITTDVTNIVETVPIYTTAATTTTALVETGPAKVLATTVPVPMLNPPINDGRRYAKLYRRNTNALGTDKGVSKLVKRRGTRRDHLVQPNVPAALTTLPLVAAPTTGAMTVIQPATLVAETRSVLPAATTGILPVAGTSTLAPTAGLTRADRRREKRVIKDQQRFAKKEQRAARKASRRDGVIAPAPIISAPVLTAPPMSAMAPLQTATYLPPLQPTTTTLVGSPALPIAQPATFVGETRSVLTQEATLMAPTTTTGMIPIGGVSARPLDHAHVLAGQLGNAPIKRPRRARKATKGTEQPMYSNIISTTPAPLTATTIASTAATTTNYTTASSMVEGTTIVQPATLVSETRNIVVDPLVQQGMIKQEYNMAPAISPLATGNPLM